MLEPKQLDELRTIRRLLPHLRSSLPGDNSLKRDPPVVYTHIIYYILIQGFISFLIMVPFSIYYWLIYPVKSLLNSLLFPYFPPYAPTLFLHMTLLFELISLTIMTSSLSTTITPILIDSLIIACQSFITKSSISFLEYVAHLIYFINFSISSIAVWSFYHFQTIKAIEEGIGRPVRILSLLDRILWMLMISSLFFLVEKKMMLDLTKSFFHIIHNLRISPSHRDIYSLCLLKQASSVFSNIPISEFEARNSSALWKIREAYPFRGRVGPHFMMASYLHLVAAFDATEYSAIFPFLSSKEKNCSIDVEGLKGILHPEDIKILPSSILDGGTCDEEAFRTTMANIATERDSILKILITNLEIIEKIDYICLLVVVFLIVFIFFPMADLRLLKKDKIPFTVGISFTPTIVGLTIIFGETVKSIFASVIFLLSTHPYDVGDSVYMDKHILFVRKINLLYTVFEKWEGFYCVYPNHCLSHKVICNIRRSGYMSQYIEFQLPITEGMESIFETLETLLNERIKEKEAHSFEGVKVSWIQIEQGGNRMSVVLRLRHRFNFFFGGEKNLRNTRFYYILFSILKDRYGVIDMPPLRIIQMDPCNVMSVVEDVFSV